MSNLTNTSTADCVLSDGYNLATYILNISAYWILPPFYFIFGFFGHIICIFVFKKEVKTNAAYGYQILVAACKLLEVLVITVYILCSTFSGFGPSKGFDFFQSNYVLMISMIKIWIPGQGIVSTLSLLSMSAMAIDRAVALCYPIAYSKMNHKKHQTTVAVLCVLISLVLGVDTFFRFNVVSSGSSYMIVQNTAFVGSDFVFHANNVRQGVRLAALVAMIAANIVFVTRFRRRSKKVAQMVLTRKSDEADAEKRAKEKTLFTIVVIISTLSVISTAWLLISSILYVAWPAFNACEGKIIIHVYTSTMLLSGMAEFYLVLLANKRFRRTARAVIKSYHEKFAAIVS